MPCPEPQRWSELADPSCRDELELHLDSCDECRELVAALAIVGTGSGPPHGAPELVARGAKIGRYTIEGAIGAGGMGIVFAAHDPELERTVALKLVRVVDRSPAAIARARAHLVVEAKAMARLAHPNVVAVHEVVDAGDELFIAMERVDGADLATWLATSPRPRLERVRMLVGAGHGIAAAHAAGLVHRDVKPHNILVGRDGRTRITDLGLAAIAELDDVAPRGGTASRLVGTPGYIAPEVAAGARGDARADQYAFAVTAWETIYGRKPVERCERGPIARVLQRALAERPDDRFATMDVLVDRLERAARARWPRYAVAAVAVAAIAFGIMASRDRATTCGGDVSAGGTLTPIRRIELAAAVTARDTSPTRLGSHVLELVDRRARAWSDAVVDVCTARERGTISAALADRRGQCLEDQRRELAATLDAIGDHASPSRALAAVAHLPAPSACDAQAPVANDILHRATRQELVAIAALRAAGRYADARARLEALANTPTDPSLAATIATRRADIEMRTGNASAAVTHAQEAVAIAERAHDDDARFAAMLVLVQVLDDLGRANETKALAPLLEAAASRQHLDDTHVAMLENTLGNAAHTAARYADAERHYRAALAASEREYAGMPAPEIAGALEDLGTVLHTEAKIDEARELLTRSVAMFEATVGPDHPDIAMPLTELGSLAFEADDNDTAATFYDRVIAVRTKALGPEHPYLCEPMIMLGNVEADRGHPDRALELYRRALALAEHGFGADHPFVAVAQLHIAQVLFARGQRAEATTRAEASVKIWDATGAVLPEAHDARFLLARLQWDAGAHARARTLAEAARVGYAALAPPYDKTATEIATWLAAHP